MNLPLQTGKENAVTGLFEDYFRSFIKIGLGTLLIRKHIGTQEYLAICPVNYEPKYVVSDIRTTGFWVFKKTYVTIEKIDK